LYEALGLFCHGAHLERGGTLGNIASHFVAPWEREMNARRHVDKDGKKRVWPQIYTDDTDQNGTWIDPCHPRKSVAQIYLSL
jgi:hypothetical protein